MITVEYVLLTL